MKPVGGRGRVPDRQHGFFTVPSALAFSSSP
jgi:hypothetical protein